MPAQTLKKLWKRLRKPSRETKRSQRLVELVNKRYDHGKLRREPFAREVVENIHFFAGNHYLKWTQGQTSLVTVAKNSPEWSTRIVENRYRRLVMAAASLLVGGDPIYEAVAAQGTDSSDRRAAELVERMLQTIWTDYKMNVSGTMRTATLWLLLGGMVGVSVQWDPHIGPMQPIPAVDDDGQLMTDEQGRPVPETDEQDRIIVDHLGDITHTIIPPLNFIPSPFSTSARDLRWYIYHTPRPLDVIRERYPNGGLVAAESIGADPFTEMDLDGFFSSKGQLHYGNDQLEDVDEAAIVKEHVIGPCKEFAKGLVYHIANGILLDHPQELDADCLKTESFGMYMARCFETPGRWWPGSLGDDMKPVQKERNAAMSLLLDCMKQTAWPKWMVAEGSHVMPASLGRKPGGQVLYKWPMKPEATSPPAVPSYVLKLAEMLGLVMEEVAQIHDVTQGRTPAGVRSGIAMATLQERDELGWSMPAAELQEMLGQVLRRHVSLVQEKYIEPRQLALVGKETGSWEMKDFTGADLKGVADIKIERGSTQRSSRASMAGMLLDVMNTPLFDMLLGDPTTATRMLEVLNLGHIQNFHDQYRLDVSVARRNLALMEAGHPPEPPGLHWNLPVHMKIIGDDLKSATTYTQKAEVQQAKRALYGEIWKSELVKTGVLNTQPAEGDEEPKPKAKPKAAPKKGKPQKG